MHVNDSEELTRCAMVGVNCFYNVIKWCRGDDKMQISYAYNVDRKINDYLWKKARKNSNTHTSHEQFRITDYDHFHRPNTHNISHLFWVGLVFEKV